MSARANSPLCYLACAPVRASGRVPENQPAGLLLHSVLRESTGSDVAGDSTTPSGDALPSCQGFRIARRVLDESEPGMFCPPARSLHIQDKPVLPPCVDVSYLDRETPGLTCKAGM